MHVILFRHGIAADARENQSDFDRPLTDEGIEKTRKAAKGLIKLCEPPDVILTSPKLRAVQTAEIVSDITGVSFHRHDALIDGDLEAIVDMLKKQPHQLILLVGHEPSLGDLATRLLIGTKAPSIIKLRKAGACLIECPLVDGDEACTQLHWHVTSKTLRQLA